MLAGAQSDYRPATNEEIRAAFGASGGSLGPVGIDVEIVADEALREGEYVAGANRDGWHLPGVRREGTTPRGSPTSARRTRATVPECGGALRFEIAIEVGHIFKFGTRYSSPSKRRSSTRTGTEKPLIGGSYGIGPGPHDGGSRGAVARRERHRLAGVDRALRRARARPARRSGRGARRGRGGRVVAVRGGHDVLLDDRDERPGEKFADADLVGCPLRVIVGKKTLDDGAVDVRERGRFDEARARPPTC